MQLGVSPTSRETSAEAVSPTPRPPGGIFLHAPLEPQQINFHDLRPFSLRRRRRPAAPFAPVPSASLVLDAALRLQQPTGTERSWDSVRFSHAAAGEWLMMAISSWELFH